MLYTNSDGGARGNPGPGAIGVIIRREGEIVARYSRFIGQRVTSNVAEYEALIKALEMASEFTNDKVTCILDSELVVRQLLGEYRVKNQKLLELFLRVQKLLDKFNEVKFLHASRWDKFQQAVDELVNEELDKRGFKKKWRGKG